MSSGQEGQTDSRRVLPLAAAYRLIEEQRAAGRLDEAVALLRQVLKARPDQPRALHLLGVIAHQRGHLEEAIRHVTRAIELDPATALFHANLGEMHRLAGRPDLAIAHGERALALNPDYAEPLSNIGIVLYEQKKYAEALAYHRRALAIKPDFAAGHSNLGNALHAMRRFDEAVACYRETVTLRPDFADAWSNLGTSLHHAGFYEEAIGALRRALALDPNNANAHSGLGLLLLMRGDFGDGLAEYEWRLRSTEVRLPYHPQRPWHGETLDGGRLHIQAEQGFGDVIQFARYLPLVAARGARITFRVQQALVGLMRQSLEGVEIVGDRSTPATPADRECALLSLPYIFGTRLETIPAAIPYLRADPAEIARWRERFAGLARFKVGLVWAGNREHVNDGRRSVDLAELAPLFAVPETSFVSMQVGPRAGELEPHLDWGIVDIGADLVGFAATAAAIEALDLVITIDSAVAHLAGALAKPTWLLTPWVSDWRWLLDREDSPWYPTMRLWRQIKGQSWHEIAGHMADELVRAVAGDGTVLAPFRESGERRADQAAAIIAATESRRRAPAKTADPSVLQLLALAERRRQTGKFAEAELFLDRILESEPACAAAHHLRGIIAHQSGNLAHAIEHVGTAARLAPDNAAYHANLCEMHRLAGRLDEAIAEGTLALALEPEFADALINLGVARYQQGEFAPAVALYKRALAAKPQSAEAHNNLGNALRALRRFAEAVPHYRRALELRPGFADPLNNLGTVLRDLQRYDEAEAAYRAALARKPDDPGTLNNLALCLKDLRRVDEALATLSRSLAIEGHNPRTIFYLAELLFRMGDLAEAGRINAMGLAIAADDPNLIDLSGKIALAARGSAAVPPGRPDAKTDAERQS
jgi:tetratricopeptide (TPR) repeat protein